jgi:hypothetical protein
VIAEPNDKPVMLMEVIEMFMKHYSEHQSEQMKHQSEQMKHQSIQNTEMFKALAERIGNQSSSAAVIVPQNVVVENNTNSHNKKFNLNLFLNEECKNAMNMSDFMKNVSITSEDLENIGELGYTEGMSKILTKAIRSTETSERPMHCTDVKRETIYVRKDDAWKKDEDCEETKRLIQHIAHKNYKALTEWSKEHPEHTEPDTADYEAWFTISRNMCNTDPSALKKLIRHLALTTAVEKNELVAAT